MNTYRVSKTNRGFTLIELLVVMAISVILMGLVLAPVVKSFELTRSAEAMVDAQDSARVGMELISRELGEAMEILDYTPDLMLPIFKVPTTCLPMPGAKIDFVLPRMIAHCNNPAHDADQSRDYERYDLISGKKYFYGAPRCPICDSDDMEVRPKLPLEQDVTVVRYFLGLRYNNPTNVRATGEPPTFGYQSPYGALVQADEGNQVVLYRIEFDPEDTAIFGLADPVGEMKKVLNDPLFFYSTDSCPGTPAKQYWQVWAEKAQIIGMGKYEDLVQAIDENNDGVLEALEPSVTFKFAKVDNDPFTGTNANDKGSESPDSAPTVFHAKYGYWTPSNYDGLADPLGVTVYRYAYDADGAVDPGNTISYITGIEGNDLVIYKQVGGGPLSITFNITDYMAAGQITSVNAEAEMGFFFDYSANSGNILLNLARGAANFALKMPDDTLNPSVLNAEFLPTAPVNRNARRYGQLQLPTNATMVAGSEVVSGPDMFGANVSGGVVVADRVVRYERVPLALGDPGVNQYKIDYSNGYIFFSSVPSQPIPDMVGTDPAVVSVSYKVQFNKNSDVVRGDYQTKAMVIVHMGIRMYNPESDKPYVVELNNTVKIRNALR